MIEVSIIIVNYNTKDLLRNCIRSIQEYTEDVSYEIIVVDNDSGDGSGEMLQQEFPEIIFISSGANLGFGKANNLGVETAQGEYVFFLNSDTLLVNNAVLILYQFAKRNPQVGICGGCLYNRELQPNLSVVLPPAVRDEFRTLLPKFMQKRQDIAAYHASTTPREVPCITGADLFIRKDVFIQVGWFDPDFFMYAEEVELTHRVKQAGLQVYIVPEAKIIHLEGMSAQSTILNQRVYKEKLYSKFLYFEKVHGKYAASKVYFFHQWKGVIAIPFFSLLGSKRKSDYWKNKQTILRESYRRYTARH